MADPASTSLHLNRREAVQTVGASAALAVASGAVGLPGSTPAATTGARRIADRIESGMVFINQPASSLPEMPFGGARTPATAANCLNWALPSSPIASSSTSSPQGRPVAA